MDFGASHFSRWLGMEPKLKTVHENRIITEADYKKKHASQYSSNLDQSKIKKKKEDGLIPHDIVVGTY